MNRCRCLMIACFCVFTVLIARAEQQWVEVSSPHFSVVTDAGEKRGREVLQRFEEMRTAFGVVFQKVNVNTAPLEIIAFRNSKEMKQYSPLYQGKPVDLAGFFQGVGGHGKPGNGEDRQYIALDLSAENNWGTVFHEYAHLLINSNFPPTPVWFDEGFAEYCSSLKMDKKEIDLGLVRPDLPYTLSEGRWLKLVDLFSVSHDSKIYNRDDRRSVFYAQSWITVHYFMTRKMMKQVSDYIRFSQDEHMPVPDAIRRGFGMEPEQLDKAIEGYYRGGSVMYFKAPAPPGSDTVAFTSHPLNDIELKTVLADLDFHAHDYRARGIAAFEEIVSKQPDNATANRGLGYAALEKNDWDKAEEYFKRAAAHDSKDPQVHYLVALGLSRKSMATRHPPDDLDTMKKELNAAIALDPGYGDAYGLLGMTLGYAGEKEGAIKALKSAIALNPRNEWNAANLASVYLRNQNFDDAVPLLKQLQGSSDAQIASMAGQQLQQVEQYKSYVTRGGKVPANLGNATVVSASDDDNDDKDEPDSKEADGKSNGAERDAVTVVTTVAPPGKPEPVLFMKGVLASVDCSQAPGAVLTITSAGKKWKMLAPDAKKLIVMGADSLSCSWANKKVAINYRKTGDDQGRLVTVELE